jgi:hypothetical protein
MAPFPSCHEQPCIHSQPVAAGPSPGRISLLTVSRPGLQYARVKKGAESGFWVLDRRSSAVRDRMQNLKTTRFAGVHGVHGDV